MEGALAAMFNVITDIGKIAVDPSLTRDVDIKGNLRLRLSREEQRIRGKLPVASKLLSTRPWICNVRLTQLEVQTRSAGKENEQEEHARIRK